MSVWESSSDPASAIPNTPDIDKHLPDNRPADGTQSGITNKTETRSVNTRLIQKDAKMLWVRDDGSIVATFSVVPEIDPVAPILVIAKEGYDAYIDVLGIDRPSFQEAITHGFIKGFNVCAR